MNETSESTQNPGYEKSDAHIKPLLISGVVLMVIMFGSLIGIVPLFKILDYYQPLFDDPVPKMAKERVISLSEPLIEIDPPRQNYIYKRETDKILTSYAWVDEDLKIARIPIQRAIDLVSSGSVELPMERPQETLENTLTLP